MDAMSWPGGTFEFTQDVLPAYVVRGTISLNASEFMHEVFRHTETGTPGSPGT
jgi:hypothetical protein